jgi:2-haloacid dehalogenase
MMVIAHSHDLAAAAQCGLRVGHIAQPNAFGSSTSEIPFSVPVDEAGKTWAI